MGAGHAPSRDRGTGQLGVAFLAGRRPVPARWRRWTLDALSPSSIGGRSCGGSPPPASRSRRSWPPATAAPALATGVPGRARVGPTFESGTPVDGPAVLKVYEWRDYLSKGTLSSFERSFPTGDVRVEVESFMHMDEAVARLQDPATAVRRVLPDDRRAAGVDRCGVAAPARPRPAAQRAQPLAVVPRRRRAVLRPGAAPLAAVHGVRERRGMARRHGRGERRARCGARPVERVLEPRLPRAGRHVRRLPRGDVARLAARRGRSTCVRPPMRSWTPPRARSPTPSRSPGCGSRTTASRKGLPEGAFAAHQAWSGDVLSAPGYAAAEGDFDLGKKLRFWSPPGLGEDRGVRPDGGLRAAAVTPTSPTRS